MKKKPNRKSKRLERADGKIPVAIYARVSSTGQDVENSTEAQIKECRKWAEEHGYVVVKEFVDKAKSGRLEKRPDFQNMVAETDSPDCAFAKVLVWRFSRFFRDYVLSCIYRERLLKNDVRVISVNEPLDDTPMGRLVQQILDAINAFQSEMISQDVQMGTHNLASRGFYVAGRAPIGMRRKEVEDGGRTRYKLEPDPKTAWIIARIHELGRQGKTSGQTAKALDKEGIRKPNGKPWEDNRVYDVFTNRHYEGTIVWGRDEDGNPVTVCENAHEGIVTPDQFQELNDLVKSRAPEFTHPREAGSKHLLSSLGNCLQCGKRYHYGRGGDNRGYILCKTRKDKGVEVCDSPRLPVEAFEMMTLAVVNEDILCQANLELAMEELHNSSGLLQNNRDDRRERLRETMEGLSKKMDKLYFAWEQGDLDYDFYHKRNLELMELRAQAKAELEKAEAELDDTQVILDQPEEVLDHSEELKNFLRKETPARARQWLKTFMKRYWVEPGYVTYEYKLPLPQGGENAGLRRNKVALEDKLVPTNRLSPRRRRSPPPEYNSHQPFRQPPATAADTPRIDGSGRTGGVITAGLSRHHYRQFLYPAQ